MSGADILMDRPPGGWSDLVTNHTLDLRFAAFEERFDAKVDALEARVERKLDALDAKVDALEARVERKLDALGATMELRFAAVGAHFADMDHRFDRFEHQLLSQVDRRLQSQAWLMISTIIAAMAVIVAAVRL